ncbi:SDR family NAD(P)-dependent oxidoreductase [Streptacidiphilus jiangxiensis]|uniref:3-oxoacyl-[acyl-carrier protein] reductase n=1 Tax=Streptacidiphilus jiangxiensis TaxID=235985 RepID=A0A1H8BHS0_STRJI|nr:SDR family oxidoreductase [Streptacidiphilus jiangxiensis]SEM81447.1 3-oxoacyl-[acyl-carrier protein] reductase [Streptacidiphilus jiangxiensis]
MTSRNVAEPPLAVVTGASGALGSAIHARLTANGWKVVATYRSRPPATGTGAESLWVRFDTDAPNPGAELGAAVEASGGALRAVFACIGAPSTKRPVAATPAEEFEQVHRANVLSLVHTWHAVAEPARAGRASLLAVGSDAGRAARAGNGPYTAAKAALEALVVTLAREEQQHGVRANLVAPSLIDSPLAHHVMQLKGVNNPDTYYQGLPWGRPLAMAEVAQVCLDVATAEHWRYATGQVYPLIAAAI